MRAQSIKPLWLMAAFVSGAAFSMLAEDLILSTRDSRIEFAAPRLHFLSGKPLDRLKNAAPVAFAFKITLWTGNHNHEFRQNYGQFVVSYDVWEEKFSVGRLNPKQAASHLSAPDAEAWCLRQMSMDVSGIGAKEPLWARLEIRAQDGKQAPIFGKDSITDSGLSLSGLIDFFSRKAEVTQHPVVAETGPVTLEELARNKGRGG